MNWIQLKNNFVNFIDVKEFTYAALEEEENIEKIYSNDEGLRSEAWKKYSSRIKSAEYFENGSIECDVKFEKDPLSYFCIIVGGFDFVVNSPLIKSAYAIRKQGLQTKALDKSGDLGSVPVNKFFNVRINVDGSNIQFQINGVIVCQTSGVVTKSQILVALRNTDKIIVKNFKINKIRPKAFIVMQFTDEYNELYKDVIKPVCESYDYDCIRADEFYQSNLILSDIINSIKEASLIIADITPDNPNVFYEVGYSHALNKPTILLSDKKRAKLPFDVSGFRTLFYDNTIGGKSKVEENLKKHLDHLNK